ncbi:MAG: DUF3530 family protein [Burkholderiales bacterium]|nr:DUF3530 family protein [Burkholderiales bacterium]
MTHKAASPVRRALRSLPGLALLLALTCPGAMGQDLDRERRWRAEVLSNLVIGDAVAIPAARGGDFLGLYTQAPPGKLAVLLVHGIGVHPDHGVIGILRGRLAEMGYTTLSIQMPVLAADARGEDYLPLLAAAAARIDAGRGWLVAKGHRALALLSHSLGATMAQEYFRSTAGKGFVGWIAVGAPGEAGMAAPGVPVLDVYGEHDLPAVMSGVAARRASVAAVPGGGQRVVRGADHFYTGRESELAAVVRDFLEKLPR